MPNGDTHTVFFLGFLDSHRNVQWNLGYAWIHVLGLPRRAAGRASGCTAMIVQRPDIASGIPFPVMLPLAVVASTRRRTLVTTYIPNVGGGINNGSMLYVFGRIGVLMRPSYDRMNVLVIGGGGREHALAWKLAQSPRVAKVFVAPGNAGTAREPGCANVALDRRSPSWSTSRSDEPIALTVVGPEAPLAAGIVDAFRAAGLRIFGPTRAAAQLESSKDFAKAFMARHGIPTAQYRTFTDAARGARVRRRRAARRSSSRPTASRPARASSSRRRARRRTPRSTRCWSTSRSASAGARVVIEEFLAGEEASFIVMVDGRHVLPLASSQDHKRLRDGDQARTPAAWARIRRRRWSRRRCTRASCARSSCPAVEGMAPTACRTPASCTRA